MTYSTVSETLGPQHLTQLYEFFVRNSTRIDDISVALWSDDYELFLEHWQPIAANLTNCVVRVIINGDRLIGIIESSSSSAGSRIGYMIDSEFEGRGIMRQYLSELLTLLVHPVEARIEQSNQRSIRLVESLDFQCDEHSLSNDHFIWRLN